MSLNYILGACHEHTSLSLPSDPDISIYDIDFNTVFVCICILKQTNKKKLYKWFLITWKWTT